MIGIDYIVYSDLGGGDPIDMHSPKYFLEWYKGHIWLEEVYDDGLLSISYPNVAILYLQVERTWRSFVCHAFALHDIELLLVMLLQQCVVVQVVEETSELSVVLVVDA